MNLLCRHSDVNNYNQAIGTYCRFPIEAIFLGLIIKRIVILKKRKIANNIVLIHILMLGWTVAFIVSDILKLVEYDGIKDKTQYHQYEQWEVDKLPRYLVILDFLQITIIQSLLIICPYCWVENMLYFLSGISAQQDNDKKARIYSRIYFFFLITTRILLLFSFICLIIIPYTIFDWFVKGIIYYTGFESVLTILWVYYGQKFLIDNYQKLAITNETNSFQMRWQSRILMVVCIVRVLNNVALTALTNINDQFMLRDFQNDLCIQYPYKIKYTLIYNTLVILMHYLPIIVMLCIYRPQKQKMLSQNTLGSSDLQKSFLV